MSDNNTNTGIGFCGLLTIVFITLKLVDKINWSWWWVLSPIWIPITLFLFIILMAAIVDIKRGQ
jgi:ATP/ADP translocase